MFLAKCLPGKWPLINSSLHQLAWARVHKECLRMGEMAKLTTGEGQAEGEVNLRRTKTAGEQREMPDQMLKSQRLDNDGKENAFSCYMCFFFFFCNAACTYLSVWSRIKEYQMFCLIQLSKMAHMQVKNELCPDVIQRVTASGYLDRQDTLSSKPEDSSSYHNHTTLISPVQFMWAEGLAGFRSTYVVLGKPLTPLRPPLPCCEKGRHTTSISASLLLLSNKMCMKL